MCEQEPERRSCTECQQYDGMRCTATDFTLGPRDEVLQQEHRRGFICIDTREQAPIADPPTIVIVKD